MKISGFCSSIKSYYKDNELKETIVDFWACMQKLLEKKILDHLSCPIDIENQESKLKFNSNLGNDQTKFIKMFSVAEERTPEIVWNDTSREELEGVL